MESLNWHEANSEMCKVDEDFNVLTDRLVELLDIKNNKRNGVYNEKNQYERD